MNPGLGNSCIQRVKETQQMYHKIRDFILDLVITWRFQDFINMLIRECNHELEKFPPIIANMQELQRRKDIKQELEKHKQGEIINLTIAN